MLLSHRRTNQVVVDSHHEHFHRTDESSGSLTFLVSFLIPSCAREENGNHHKDNDPYLRHSLGDAEVDRSHLSSVSHLLVDLAVMGSIEEEWSGQTVSCADMPFAGLRAAHDNGQRNADVLTLVCGYVPLV